VVESMACGTPVIAFERGSMAEIIRDGSTGFLVDDVDAAVRAVARLDTIDRRRCRDEVETRFTSRRMADDYLAVYHKILNSVRLEDDHGRY